MEQLRDFDIVVLDNLKTILGNFVKNNNINLIWSLRLTKCGEFANGYENHINKVLSGALYTLSYELLVLITELFNKDGLDCTTNEFRKFFNEIKQDFPEELKKMNASEFLKTLRNSIAHNSEINQNFKAMNHDECRVHLKKKGESLESDKVFSKLQLLKILEVYDAHKKSEKVFGSVDISINNPTGKRLLNEYKRTGTFNSIITMYNKDGNVIPMDNFQEKAFFKYLLKNKHLILGNGEVEYEIMRFLPYTDNKLAHYENKYHLTIALDFLIDNFNISCNDFVKILKKNDPRGIMPFLDVEFLNSLIVSSMAFNIFSTRSASELKVMTDGYNINLSEEELNHLRNSFVHGRYFYNYNNGFEIYDGTRSLSHIMTISIDTLYELSAIVCKPGYEDYLNRKRQELNELLNVK